MLRKSCIVFVCCLFTLPAVVNAHNVGHVFLPDGTCLEVGSVKEAPLVGRDRTQLDLVPGTANPPRDEYGTSFAGYWGRTPISPGRCPVVTGSPPVAGPGSGASAGPSAATSNSRSTGPSATSGPTGPWVSFGPKKDR